MPIIKTLAAAIVLVVFSTHTQADNGANQYHIPTQNLATALQNLSQQSGLQMLYDGAAVQGKRSTALNGSYTPQQALRALLAGSGLGFVPTGANAVAVKPMSDSDGFLKVADTGEGQMMPKVTVEADSGNPYDDPNWATDPYNTDYNRPNATTATKTDTPIMETPVNIQVVPQQVLKDQQVININKALQNVSGVYAVGANRGSGLQGTFSLRGFDNFSGTSTTTYRDGYRNGYSLYGASAEMANVQRLEVLKGPAAILYGRGEPGGLVNLVTKKPLAQPYYELGQQFGSFDQYRTTIDATGPLTQDDTVLYRLNGAYLTEGSFVQGDSSERVFVAPVVTWNVSPRTQANFYVDYQHDEFINNAGIPALNGRPVRIPREQRFSESAGPSKLDFLRAGFNWSHAFTDRWTLRHRFEYQRNDQVLPPSIGPDDFPDPATCTLQSCPLPRSASALPKNLVQTYNTTVDLTGQFDLWGGTHKVLLGGEYWRLSQADLFSVYTAPNLSIDLFRPILTGVPPVPDVATVENGLDTSGGLDVQDWYGFYMQDQVELPHGVHLLAGFRYDHATTASGDRTAITADGVTVTPASTQTDEAVTPRFGILWQALPQLSLYGNYTENFGANNGRTEGNTLLPPQTAQQWEVGAKTELFDKRLTGTLAWFDITKQNLLRPHSDLGLRRLGFVEVTGEARSRGLEFDLSGELWPGLRAIGSYAYIDAVVTKDSGEDADGNLTPGNTGNRLFGVPRHGGSLWLNYAPDGGRLAGLQLGAGAVLRSEQQGDNENTFQIPGFVTVNLMVGYDWKIGPSKVSVQLNIDNLLDKDYFDNFGGNGGTNPVYAYPRTFLGSLHVEF